MTYIDFLLYELLDQQIFIEPTVFAEHNNLQDFLERFRSLPAISAYMHSDEFMKFPIWGPMAKFGGKR